MGIFFCKDLVGHIGVLLDKVREVVRILGAEDEESRDDPVINQGRVLRGKAIEPAGIATQSLHNEKVMKFIVLLR